MPPTTGPSSPIGDLGKLSPELRNEIYKQALTSANPIEISRCRYPNPKWTPVNDKKRIYRGQSKCYRGWEGVVRRPRGKKSCKVPTERVLAINLLRTSKAIQNEATSILYGANNFEFQSAFAFEKFTSSSAGLRFPLITCISIGVEYNMDKIFESIRCLNRLEQIELRLHFIFSRLPGSVATEEARRTWERISSFVSKERLRVDMGDTFDFPHGTVDVDLPQELKVRRLRLFYFAVPKDVEFEIKE